MPLPKTKDIGKILSFLKKDKPTMPRKQKIAIALSQAKKNNKKLKKKIYKSKK